MKRKAVANTEPRLILQIMGSTALVLKPTLSGHVIEKVNPKAFELAQPGSLVIIAQIPLPKEAA
jgi:hypothetical protein